ncbi:MAG TPA: hypothetical protein VFC92_04520 [Bacteroidales bacterium]|nr:hypothetical protein [Bacteroidales bacterium]
MTKFRFEQLEIWEFAIEISNQLFDLDDLLNEKEEVLICKVFKRVAMSYLYPTPFIIGISRLAMHSTLRPAPCAPRLAPNQQYQC